MSVRQISPKKYQIDYYPEGRKGKRKRVYFIGTEAEALDLEKTLRRTSPRKEIVNAPIRKLVPEFFESYKNDHQATTVVDAGFAFKHLEPLFGSLPISRISPALVEQYKGARLAAGVKKRTINKELSYLAALVSWAERMGYANPLEFKIRKFPMKQTKPPVPVIPSPEELDKILEELPQDKRGLFLLMYHNGLRRTEALSLRADQVDVKAGILRIMGKGGKEAVIPIITDRLKEELARKVKENPAGYLYPNPRSKTGEPYKDIRDGIKNAASRAGVDKRIYHHLLRHSFGTHAMISGVSQKAVQGILRHSSMQTTDIYTHIASDFLKGEGAKFAAAIDAPKLTTADKAALERSLTTPVKKKTKKAA